MSIELSFALPFSLRVDGTFALQTPEERFEVTLLTQRNARPNFPGAEQVVGLDILHDDSTIMASTRVTARYTPRSGVPSDAEEYSRQVSDVAVSIANALITGLRVAFNEYHIDYLYSADKLGPVAFAVSPANGDRGFSGLHDRMQGGITLRRPPRAGDQAKPFADALAGAAGLSPAQEILFNARRYLLRGDKRMALANLAISFEVGLADCLAKAAAANGDVALQSEIANAALNNLGTGLAVRALGYSFANKSVWGERFAETFEWLRVARNGVLHKAQLNMTYAGRTRDFADRSELQALFRERDWFMSELDIAVDRVIARQLPQSRSP